MKYLMKNSFVLVCTFLSLFYSTKVLSQQTLTQINGWNAYVHLPSSYNSNNNTYPTIIFFPGIGEIGYNAGAVIANGPGAYIAQGWDGNVNIDGTTVEFIVVSLQPPSGFPNEWILNDKIEAVKSLYRVNTNKLYLTGLSMGGWCSTTYVTGDNYGGPYTYASKIAAVVTVQGMKPDDNSPYPALFDNYANVGGRYLGFEQSQDGRDTKTVVDRMNATKPGSAIHVLTNFGGGGHCCWNSFYGGQGTQPGVFMLDGKNQNLYQWLARQSFGVSSIPPPVVVNNQPPTVTTGGNKTITLPTNSATLSATGSDPDGTIVSYAWTQLSGPSTSTIVNANTIVPTMIYLLAGTYNYQVKVTDNQGATATATASITVNAAPVVPPSVSVCANQTLTLPTNSASLSGNGSSTVSTINSYSWTKVSGPNGGNLSNAGSANTSITSLEAGTYQYQLKVTDGLGLSATATTTVTVNAAQTTSGGCNTAAPVTYNLSQTGPGEIYRPNGSAWKGGDTIKITGTNYSVIEFYNVSGDPCRPIVIMPATTLTTPVFRIKGDCKYLKIWGGKTKYGIKVANGAIAINLSHHIEVDNVECYGNNIGVYCKTDPVYDDKRTWYPNYPQPKFTFKNMYIHDVSGEGMYIGMTQVSGITVRSTYSGQDTTIIPNRMDSVEISNCVLERCQWDGIQLSNSRNGNKIFNNIVKDYGTINMSSQQAGILMGGNTTGDIYNNTVIRGTGNGIQVFGYGTINIYGNTLDSCGYDGNTNSNGTQGQQSIYVSDYINTVEQNPKQTVNVYGNSVNRPKTSGGIFITGYYNNSNPSTVNNNLFCIPNAASNWQSTFIKAYVSGSSVTNNNLSCSGAANLPPVAKAGAAQSITLPANSVNLNGTGTDPEGSAVTFRWAQVAGPGQAQIAAPGQASTAINNLVQGVYQFELTVTDDLGAFARDSVSITVMPATVSLLPAVTPGNTVNGLDYKYYEGSWSAIPAFNSLTPVKTGTSANGFDISLANKQDLFGFSFTGYINIAADGVYNFFTSSDDGSSLYIDDVLVVNNDGLHGTQEKSGSIGLKAGLHAIKGLFFEQGGDQVFIVSYSGVGIVKQEVPASVLFRVYVPVVNLLPASNPSNTVNGLDYKYYEGSWTKLPNFASLSPVKTGTAASFDISVANRQDQFGFSFTGYIDVPADGQYTFHTTSDDGSALYIDDVLVVNNDGLHAAEEKSGTIGLKAGKHAITGLFFEQSGGEVFVVNYEGMGISKRQVPTSALYRVAPTPSITLLPASNPANAVSGIDYKYYEGYWNTVPNFSALTPVKTGTTSTFDISVANKQDQFGFSFTGYVDVPADGSYTFYTNSDDGSMLYIDNILVVNNDGLHGAVEKSGTIGLKAGKHAITGLFFEQGGDQVFTVSYEGMGISKKAIPAAALYRVSTAQTSNLLPASYPANPVSGLNYKYYEGTWTNVPNFSLLTPKQTGTTSNFNISLATAGNLFAINFTGFIEVPADGQYNFYTTSDDGSLIYIDDVLVVNNDGLHGPQERSGTIGLKAGKHRISAQYFDQLGSHMFYVGYDGPGISKVLVPSSALFRDAAANFAGTITTGTSTKAVTDGAESFKVAETETVIESAATVYPNPFTTAFKVQLMDKAAAVYVLNLVDINGRRLLQKKVNKPAGQMVETIPAANLAPGTYILQIVGENGKTTTHKLVKK